MSILQLRTVTEEWCTNVMKAVAKGMEIDFWIRNRIPRQEVSDVEIYYHDKLILTGEVVEKYDNKSLEDTFAEYASKKHLEALGLASSATLNDFQELLNQAFDGREISKLGNVIIRINGIADDLGVTFPKEHQMLTQMGMKVVSARKLERGKRSLVISYR